MPSPLELVAHERTDEEIAERIGADLVIYQSLPDLIESCRQFNPSIESFDCSVFTGEYVTGGVDERYLEHLARLRNDKAQAKKRQSVVDDMEMLNDSCNGPMSGSFHISLIPTDLILVSDGSDTLIGLPNHSPKIGPVNGMPTPNDGIGLHNSWYGS